MEALKGGYLQLGRSPPPSLLLTLTCITPCLALRPLSWSLSPRGFLHSRQDFTQPLAMRSALGSASRASQAGAGHTGRGGWCGIPRAHLSHDCPGVTNAAQVDLAKLETYRFPKLKLRR